MNEWTTYAGRLIWAMEHAGQTNQSELARAIGIKPQSIQYLCRRDAGAQGSKHTAALAKALGVSPQWLARNEGLPDAPPATVLMAAESASVYALEPADDQPDGPMAERGSGRVAVSGTYRVSGTGDIEEIEPPPHTAIGDLPRPSQLGRLRAVRIKGNALSPFVKDGQYLLLQDAGAIHPEENVVVELVGGRVLIREVLFDKPEALVVLPLHGGQPEALERRDITRLTPVICALPASLWRPGATTG
ncbi:MAG: XRE family transcriptional regulator [Rubrivivax sp.]|nr:MAG: XRE family transcriptional regulator [Rubrivivax sp.]